MTAPGDSRRSASGLRSWKVSTAPIPPPSSGCRSSGSRARCGAPACGCPRADAGGLGPRSRLLARTAALGRAAEAVRAPSRLGRGRAAGVCGLAARAGSPAAHERPRAGFFMVASRSSTVPSSGGSGVLMLNSPPCGQSKLTLCACRNMRARPSARSLVEAGVTVLLVARHRVPGVRGVHADLVRAAGLERHLQQGRDPAEELHGTKIADRRLAAGVRPAPCARRPRGYRCAAAHRCVCVPRSQ